MNPILSFPYGFAVIPTWVFKVLLLQSSKRLFLSYTKFSHVIGSISDFLFCLIDIYPWTSTVNFRGLTSLTIVVSLKKKIAVTKSQILVLWSDLSYSFWPLKVFGFRVFKTGPQAYFDALSPNMFAKKTPSFGGQSWFLLLALTVAVAFCIYISWHVYLS